MFNDTTNSTSSNPDPIPEEVIEALAEVRESGAINMFDRNGVIKLVFEFDLIEAASWLIENKSRYMDALYEMGKTVQS